MWYKKSIIPAAALLVAASTFSANQAYALSDDEAAVLVGLAVGSVDLIPQRLAVVAYSTSAAETYSFDSTLILEFVEFVEFASFCRSKTVCLFAFETPILFICSPDDCLHAL